MTAMNVSLSGPMDEWVQHRIDSGEFASASDYLSELIRRDKLVAEQQQALSNALAEGEASGLSHRTVLDIIRDSTSTS